MSKRYFIDTDNSGHRFIVEADQLSAWQRWNSLPEDSEEAWEAPAFATRIDGAHVTFEQPLVDGQPLPQ